MGSDAATGDAENGDGCALLETESGLKFGEKGFVSGKGSLYELGSTAVVTGTGGCVTCRMFSYGTAASREPEGLDLPG